MCRQDALHASIPWLFYARNNGHRLVEIASAFRGRGILFQELTDAGDRINLILDPREAMAFILVDFKVYENEGHGFSRVENQIDAITRVGEFLKKYAPPAKCGCNLD